MKILFGAIPLLCVCSLAQADFSYTQTRRTTGGMMAGMAGGNAGPQQTKVSLKGQKMKTDSGAVTTVIDLDAQTITTIDNTQKTYTVKNFSDLAAGTNNLNATADVKETGQKKSVNGFNSTEAVMTMEMEMPRLGKAQMEMDMWLSTEVPGLEEVRSFYAKNADKFPWAAMGGGANSGIGSALAEVQKKIASMKAIPVQQIMRVKAPGAMPGASGGAGGPSAAQMGQMQAGMEKARKQLEALASSGGPAAAIAKQQLDRMGPAPSAGAPAAGSPSSANWLLEMTIDSSEFSSARIPDTVFEIPAGYKKN